MHAQPWLNCTRSQIVHQAADVTARLNDDVKRGIQTLLLKPAAEAREARPNIPFRAHRMARLTVPMQPGQHADVQLVDAKNELTRCADAHALS